MELSEFLSQRYLGNSVEDYCWLLGMILLGLIFKKFFSKILSNLLYKAVQKYAEGVESEKMFELLHRPLSWFVMLIIFYSSTTHIEFPAEWNLETVEKFGLRMIIERIYQLLFISSIAWVVLRFVDFVGLILLKKAEKTESKQDDQIIPFAIEFLKIIVLIFSIFIVLGSVFKVNVGSLVAGLGIGGLALALAAKESLENLLSSFLIFFDKPFIVGDLVKVGSISGTVEKVGFRSTRIRTLEKSYLTVPNKKMIDAELDNLSLRTFRRVNFNIGLVYGTTKEQMQGVVSDIQKYIDEHKHTNQDGKVRFTQFGASSLDIMVLYFIDTMDFGVFLEVQEEINFKIMEIVKSHNTDFAYPTQTLFVHNQNLK
jgi:MscS family membrane protein